MQAYGGHSKSQGLVFRLLSYTLQVLGVVVWGGGVTIRLQ